jgi:hypothetical protein
MSYRALRSQCAITDWRREQDVKRALTKRWELVWHSVGRSG